MQMTQDYNYINQKLFITAVLKILRILVQILLMVYFVAQIWGAFVDIYELNYPEDSEHDNFFHNYKWSLANHDDHDVFIILLYFSLTSLSTIGLGDYHPITNYERLLCTSLFLIGVILFSYALG